MKKFTINPYVDTPEYRAHRHLIIERDLGMCRICGSGGHQLCWTRTEAVTCCRKCATVAQGTSFSSLTALISFVSGKRSLPKSRS